MLLVENDLTKQAIAGDPDALNQLLGRYDERLRARLTPRIGARLRQELEIEELLQVTYMEAFLRIGGFEHRGSGSFLAWLTRIGENNLRDAARAMNYGNRLPPEKRIHTVGTDSHVLLLELLPGTRTTPSVQLRLKEAKSLLEETLAQLPADYEAVIRMYCLAGLPIDHVANALDRSVPAVHMLKVRAHAWLSECLSESQFFSSCR